MPLVIDLFICMRTFCRQTQRSCASSSKRHRKRAHGCGPDSFLSPSHGLRESTCVNMRTCLYRDAYNNHPSLWECVRTRMVRHASKSH